MDRLYEDRCEGKEPPIRPPDMAADASEGDNRRTKASAAAATAVTGSFDIFLPTEKRIGVGSVDLRRDLAVVPRFVSVDVEVVGAFVNASESS
jgi:hypothetical protein